MENNYEIRKNQQQPSSEEIAKHQDFDALLDTFNQTPSPQASPNSNFRWLRFSGLALAAATMMFMLYQGFLMFQTKQNEKTDKFAYVNPPIPNIDKPFAKFVVNNDENVEITHTTGTKINIPAKAFIDDKGNNIQGEIIIKYREMHDFVDFFISGVPMYYDSANVRYQLLSSGMMEILAEQNGKRVNIEPGKNIQIDMPSEINVKSGYELPKYNVYRLDTEQRNWVYKGNDNVEILEQSAIINEKENNNPQQASLQKELLEKHKKIEASFKDKYAEVIKTIPEPLVPIQPEKANTKDFVFDLDLGDMNLGDKSKSNDAQAQYDGTLWQVAPNQEGFDEKTAKNAWEDFKIKQLNNREYELTLTGKNQKMTVKVIPVLNGKDYEKALKAFSSEYETYEKDLKSRAEKLAAAKLEMDKQMQIEKEIAQLSNNEKIETLKAKGFLVSASHQMIKHKIINRFQVDNTGIWNCDHPMPPDINQMNGTFVDNLKNKYSDHIVYLVNRSENTIRTIPVFDNCKVQYKPNDQNIMWLLTQDNKIAVFKPEDFEKIDQKNDNFTFVMNVDNTVINDEEDIRKILDF